MRLIFNIYFHTITIFLSWWLSYHRSSLSWTFSSLANAADTHSKTPEKEIPSTWKLQNVKLPFECETEFFFSILLTTRIVILLWFSVAWAVPRLVLPVWGYKLMIRFLGFWFPRSITFRNWVCNQTNCHFFKKPRAFWILFHKRILNLSLVLIQIPNVKCKQSQHGIFAFCLSKF